VGHIRKHQNYQKQASSEMATAKQKLSPMKVQLLNELSYDFYA